MLKKIISVLLCISLCLGVFTIAVSAGDSDFPSNPLIPDEPIPASDEIIERLSANTNSIAARQNVPNVEAWKAAVEKWTATVSAIFGVVRNITTVISLVNGVVNGDGTDAMIVDCIANGLLTREQVGEAQYMAADCNHDGAIDGIDVGILQQAGILLANVNQSKPIDELLETSSEYVEYLSLIDQTNKTDNQEDIKEDTKENQCKVFRMIISVIKHLFTVIKSAFAFIF